MTNYKNVVGKPNITRELEIEVFKFRLSGMHQRAVSRELSLSPATVNMLCKGKYRFKADTLDRTPEAEELFVKVTALEEQDAIRRNWPNQK